MNTSEWENAVFQYPDHISTMISTEEKQYLYWLGGSVWQGKGLIVEIGPWLGGSTWCLAAGMNSSWHTTDKRLIVFDNFIWRDFMSERAALNLKPGDSFQAEFLKNLSMYDSIVDSYKRALPDETIVSDQEAQSKRYASEENVALFEGVPGSASVEILFVDGAKSWLGLKHLLLNVSERLVPGQSILVCQDFKYWGNYWVPLLLTFLSDHLEPIHNVLSATTVTFRLIRPISRDDLQPMADHIVGVPTDDALIAINRAAEMLRTNGDILGSAHVELGKVMFLSHQNQLDRAVDAFRESQVNWPRVTETGQLERARRYLADSQSIYIAPGMVARAIQPALRAVKLAKRVARRVLRPTRRGQ